MSRKDEIVLKFTHFNSIQPTEGWKLSIYTNLIQHTPCSFIDFVKCELIEYKRTVPQNIIEDIDIDNIELVDLWQNCSDGTTYKLEQRGLAINSAENDMNFFEYIKSRENTDLESCNHYINTNYHTYEEGDGFLNRISAMFYVRPCNHTEIIHTTQSSQLVYEPTNIDTCVVCMSNTRDTLTIPCNHLVLCNHCYDRICETSPELFCPRCPICRVTINGSVQVT